jgi:hypothetical protein
VALFKTNPEGSTLTGKAPFTVEFNMCRTVDPGRRPAALQDGSRRESTFEFLGSSGRTAGIRRSTPQGTVTATQCVTDVNCPSWPLCNDYPPLHPYRCRSYTVTAVPWAPAGAEPNTSRNCHTHAPAAAVGP